MKTFVTVTSDEPLRIVPGQFKGEVHWAEWKEYTTARWFSIYTQLHDDETIRESDGTKHKERKFRFDRFPRLIIRQMLLESSFMKIDHSVEGLVTDECLNVIMGMKPAFVAALIMPFNKMTDIGEDEERQMQREGLVYFGHSKGGVENPCFALHFHSLLSTFWDNYGLNYFDLQNFPVEHGVRLKEMLSIKADAVKLEPPPPPKPTGGRHTIRGR